MIVRSGELTIRQVELDLGSIDPAHLEVTVDGRRLDGIEILGSAAATRIVLPTAVTLAAGQSLRISATGPSA